MPTLQHRPLDPSQAAYFLTHLHLGMAVGFEDGLGQVAEEMVGAVAMRHVGEFRGDPRHEGVLLVRDPKRDRLAEGGGPSFGLLDQSSDFVGRRGEQRFGEPDALACQFANDVERLVSFFGLQAVDREDDRIDPMIVLTQGLGVLLTRREHRLIASDVLGDSAFGEVDREGVVQFAADLGDRPVT